MVYTALTICVVGPVGAGLYFIYGAFHHEISGTLSQPAHMPSNSVESNLEIHWQVKFQAALEFSFCMFLLDFTSLKKYSFTFWQWVWSVCGQKKEASESTTMELLES